MRYFFFNEQNEVSMILFLNIVLGGILAHFFYQHMVLIMKNMTTNEEAKKKDFISRLEKDETIINRLIKDLDEWKPKSGKPEHQVLPPMIIDNIKMADDKIKRMQHFKDLLKKNQKRIKKLTEACPYKPKPNLFKALIEIWNEE